MSVAFLFLDECSYEPLDLAALTGVLVPADRYASVRDAICKLVADVQPSPPNTVPAAIELHARALLTDIAHLHGDGIDSVRISVFERVAALLAEHQLHVYRVAYLNRSAIAKMMPIDPKLYGITFSGVSGWLSELMRDTLVIPVMDGVPATGGADIPRPAPRVDPVLVRAFAGNVRGIHHFRQYPVVAKNLTVINAHNLGEPLFADSAHSVLLQLVDIVSHMLLQRERAELEGETALSDFRRKTLAVARSVPEHLLHLWKDKMQLDDGAAAPAEADGGPSP